MKEKVADKLRLVSAALIGQRAIRGYLARKRYQTLKEDEMRRGLEAEERKRKVDAEKEEDRVEAEEVAKQREAAEMRKQDGYQSKVWHNSLWLYVVLIT